MRGSSLTRLWNCSESCANGTALCSGRVEAGESQNITGGGVKRMSASARSILATDRVLPRNIRSNGATKIARTETERKPRPDAAKECAGKLSVFVAADNRLLREALAR